MTVATAVDRVKAIFSGRDGLVREREATAAKIAAAAAARQAAIDQAQVEVDAFDEPRRRLERLRAEAAALSTAEQHVR